MILISIVNNIPNQPHMMCMISFFFHFISLQVAWMHFEQSAILTVHNHVITRNPRVSVTHDKHDRHRTWYLHINNVHEEDKGRYMCQINTVTAKTQFGYLNVVGKWHYFYFFTFTIFLFEGNLKMECNLMFTKLLTMVNFRINLK